ncbi:MAG: hypothetical protein U0441_28060 [Polyangiaceae bacterium]
MTSRLLVLGLFGLALGATGALGCGGNVVLSSGETGGAGGGTTTTGTGGQTGTTSNIQCAGLDHITCLSSYPSCVPVYDDFCCPTCTPTGGCADCIDLQFDHCDDFENRCTGVPSQCGQTPDWACTGGQADCNIDPGGVTPCDTVAGCLPAQCSPILESCPASVVCHPATKGTCLVNCKQTPPPCPAGTWPEATDGCYTGYCVPENVCVIGL